MISTRRLPLLPFCLWIGLVATTPEAAEPRTAPTNAARFPPVQGANVKLECVSAQRVFTAGQAATMTFRLKNLGGKPVVIYEWLMEEGKNLALHYAPSTGNESEPAPDNVAWLTLRPEVGAADRRMSLELAPGNAALIKCELTFVGQLQPKELAAPRQYLLYGELNLMSLPAKSQVVVITVQP